MDPHRFVGLVALISKAMLLVMPLGGVSPNTVIGPSYSGGVNGSSLGNPTATGSARPSFMPPGGAVLFVVTVNPGTTPDSTGIAVVGDLSTLGGSASQQFYDDGTHGDITAGDNRFSFQTNVSSATLSGSKTIVVAVGDAQLRTAATTIRLTVGFDLIFAQIADGPQNRTHILLTNPSATATTATISFWSDTGTPLILNIDGVNASSIQVPVPAFGSAKVATSGLSPDTTSGWAGVNADPPVDLVGNAVFQYYTGSSLFCEASVPGMQPAAAMDFYADEESPFKTSYAIVNPGSLRAQGTLTLRRKDGTIFNSAPITVEPGNHFAKFLWEDFGLDDPSGRAEIVMRTGYVAATSLRYHTSWLYSSVNVGQPGHAAANVNAMFSPNGGVRNRILAEINKAQSTIDIAIYSFTADQIRDALIAAKNGGVAIRIIADTSSVGSSGSEITTLQGLGFNLKTMAGIGSGIMHNKYMIVDGKVLFTGSYNWSASAEGFNFENALFISASAVIRKYQDDFDAMWAR